MTDSKPKQKPRLRGYFHQEAFYVALGACALLIAKCSTHLQLATVIIYTIGLLMMFGISAIYHRPHWSPKSRAFLKRLDHAAIFILIAGTATPIFLLSIPEEQGHQFIVIMWAIAIFGILQSIFWIKAPKFITAALYIGMGWLSYPYLTAVKETLGSLNLSLTIAGGVFYTAGAVFYAARRPKLWPSTFGYHEVFHVFTIIAAALHFVVIYRLLG